MHKEVWMFIFRLGFLWDSFWYSGFGNSTRRIEEEDDWFKEMQKSYSRNLCMYSVWKNGELVMWQRRYSCRYEQLIGAADMNSWSELQIWTADRSCRYELQIGAADMNCRLELQIWTADRAADIQLIWSCKIAEMILWYKADMEL
jgi:hypothetical protein